MYIARDKNNRLYVYHHPPVKRRDDFGPSEHETIFPVKEIDKSLFPEVTFENSPKEIVIKN